MERKWPLEYKILLKYLLISYSFLFIAVFVID